jgi:murein DD-endopeptidase MepM/ murein hydrolase activator NlpD
MASRPDNLQAVRARAIGRVCVGLGFLAAAVSAPTPALAAQVKPQATGSAYAIRVLLPDGVEETLALAKAPPATYVSSAGLVYEEGVVTTGSIWTRSRTVSGAEPRAASGATVRTVSLFGGEITAGAVSTKARSRIESGRVHGGLKGSWLAEVSILGQPVRATPNLRVPLADWGYAVLLEQAVVRETGRRIGGRTFVSGLHVHLTSDHAGLPAGTEVVVGYAEAAVRAPRLKKPGETPTPGETGTPTAPSPGPDRDPVPQPPGSDPTPPPVVQSPPRSVQPDFTADGYVFPVYGPSSFGDDFAAPRSLTGWHHGNDIFAPLGAPVLAITEGTLFLVGWNDVGGNRLWLRDDQGNEFYYAHLSAFSPLAVDGGRVKAGDVIGFVGATGDAVGTPPHLHFEIHPAALLGLGYDGVVNPYAYLLAWHKLVDASFDWAVPRAGKAPPPGLVLLEADDISTVSGLDPEGLSRAMELPALFGKALSPAGPEILPSG